MPHWMNKWERPLTPPFSPHVTTMQQVQTIAIERLLRCINLTSNEKRDHSTLLMGASGSGKNRVSLRVAARLNFSTIVVVVPKVLFGTWRRAAEDLGMSSPGNKNAKGDTRIVLYSHETLLRRRNGEIEEPANRVSVDGSGVFWIFDHCEYLFIDGKSRLRKSATRLAEYVRRNSKNKSMLIFRGGDIDTPVAPQYLPHLLTLMGIFDIKKKTWDNRMCELMSDPSAAAATALPDQTAKFMRSSDAPIEHRMAAYFVHVVRWEKVVLLDFPDVIAASPRTAWWSSPTTQTKNMGFVQLNHHPKTIPSVDLSQLCPDNPTEMISIVDEHLRTQEGLSLDHLCDILMDRRYGCLCATATATTAAPRQNPSRCCRKKRIVVVFHDKETCRNFAAMMMHSNRQIMCLTFFELLNTSCSGVLDWFNIQSGESDEWETHLWMAVTLTEWMAQQIVSAVAHATSLVAASDEDAILSVFVFGNSTTDVNELRKIEYTLAASGDDHPTTPPGAISDDLAVSVSHASRRTTVATTAMSNSFTQIHNFSYNMWKFLHDKPFFASIPPNIYDQLFHTRHFDPHAVRLLRCC